MKKGIVMEMNRRFLTVLTPEGEFIKVKRENYPYTIGEEILIPIQKGNWLTNRNWAFPKILTNPSFGISAIIAVLILFIATAFIPKDEVYAYVSLDINPSMELAVNKEAEVIKIIPYNEEAEQIVTKLDSWKNKELDKVTGNIINLIEMDGYFEGNNEIVIGTVVLNEKDENIEEEITQSLNQIKTELVKEDIDCIEITATEQDREIASGQGTTVGQYVGKKIGKSKKNEESLPSGTPGKQKDIPPVKVPEKPASKPVDKDWNNGKQLGKDKEKKKNDIVNENKNKNKTENELADNPVGKDKNFKNDRKDKSKDDNSDKDGKGKNNDNSAKDGKGKNNNGNSNKEGKDKNNNENSNKNNKDNNNGNSHHDRNDNNNISKVHPHR